MYRKGEDWDFSVSTTCLTHRKLLINLRAGKDARVERSKQVVLARVAADLPIGRPTKATSCMSKDSKRKRLKSTRDSIVSINKDSVPTVIALLLNENPDMFADVARKLDPWFKEECLKIVLASFPQMRSFLVEKNTVMSLSLCVEMKYTMAISWRSCFRGLQF